MNNISKALRRLRQEDNKFKNMEDLFLYVVRPFLKLKKENDPRHIDAYNPLQILRQENCIEVTLGYTVGSR